MPRIADKGLSGQHRQVATAPVDYVGIDPGQSGGIAVLCGGTVDAHKMPETERDIWQIFKDVEMPCIAVIEKVHSMPDQGVASSFKFGRGYGFLRGCLIAGGIPFEEVTPQAWIKGLAIPSKAKTETRTQWKNRLKAMAQQLYPDLKVTLATADALLIATYNKRKHEGTL